MSSDVSAAPISAPAIHISAADYDLIAELAVRMEPHDEKFSQRILSEIDRAHICETQVSADVVAIGSRVTFLDDSNGAQRTAELVLPGRADISQNRVSVMTTVGAGLMGLRAGSEIEWPCPDGRARSLKILRVERAPE